MNTQGGHDRRSYANSNTDCPIHREMLFHLLVDSVKDYAIFALSPDGYVSSWNTGAAYLKGYSSDEIIGRHFSLFYSVKDVSLGKPQHGLEIARAEGRYEDEGCRYRKDGSQFLASVIITPIWDAAGTLVGYSKVTRDITESMHAESLLEASEARLILATESAHIGVWDWDVPTNKITWDAQMCALYGLRKVEFGGEYDAWEQGVHPEDRARANCEIRAALEGVGDFHTQFRVVWPCGEVRHIEAHAVVQRAHDGSPLRMIGVNWDVTARVEAEAVLLRSRDELELRVRERTAELREREEHFRATFEQAAVGIAHVALDGAWLAVNSKLCEILGYSREDLLQITFQDITHADDLDKDLSYVAQMLAGEIPTYTMEKRYYRKDHSVVWARLTVSLVRDPVRAAGYFLSIVEDITERKEAQDLLRASEERFRLFTEQVVDYTMFLLDPDGVVQSWNKGAERTMGYQANEVIGQSFSRFYSAEDVAAGLPELMLKRAATDGCCEQEGWRIRKDGSQFWAKRVVTALRDETGVLVGFAKVTRDLSELRLSEKAQRLIGAHMDAIVNAVLDGIVTIDDEGIIESFNPAAARAFGYDAAEVIGQNVKLLMPELYQSEHAGYLAGSYNTGDKKVIGTRLEVDARRKDGTIFPIDLAVSEVLVDDRHMFVGTLRDISERKSNEAALRCAQEELEIKVAQRTDELARSTNDLHMIINSVPSMISYWGSDLRNRFANRAYTDWLGVTPEEIRGRHIREVLGEDLFAERSAYINAALNGEEQHFDQPFVLSTGGINYTQASYIPDFREGRVQGYYVLATDITERKEAELALFAEKERARVTLSSIGDGVITTDIDGRVTYLNPIAESMTGWSMHGAIGVSIEDVMVIRDATTGEPMASPIRLALEQGRIVGLASNCVLQSRDRGEFSIENSGAPIRDNSGAIIGAVIVFHDVTEARAMTVKMSYLAQHDALTNLPNRLLLRDRIAQAIQSSRRNGVCFALFFLDLDHFKNVNDSLGHAAGDELLQAVAQRLTGCLREMDTVSRQGGDEFIVLLAGVDSVEQTRNIAQRLLDAVAEPYEIGGEKVSVTFSIGISVSPEDGDDPDTLMRHADAAMYSAKRAGRNRYYFFSRAIDEAVTRRHNLERDIRTGLEAGEFSVYYQLKVDSETNRAIGNEALIRWHRPGGEVVSPIHFIPVAEESGLIVPLGKFVLKEACRQNRQWQEAGLPPVPIAVNFSGAQIKDPDFVPMVERVLLETGMSPEYLELEITEGTLIETVGEAAPVLDKLRGMGVRIALDDFGTGYSSLSHLRHLPVDSLKIDRSFVTDLLVNTNDNAIVSAIIGMGRGLGLEVIAEGVETEEQAAHLRHLQCPLMQGYLFSRPLPGGQATRMMETYAV